MESRQQSRAIGPQSAQIIRKIRARRSEKFDPGESTPDCNAADGPPPDPKETISALPLRRNPSESSSALRLELTAAEWLCLHQGLLASR